MKSCLVKLPLARGVSFVSLLAVFVLAGCANIGANSGAVGTAQQVAEGAHKYVATLQKVNALALDHSLDFTADLLPGNLPIFNGVRK